MRALPSLLLLTACDLFDEGFSTEAPTLDAYVESLCLYYAECQPWSYEEGACEPDVRASVDCNYDQRAGEACLNALKDLGCDAADTFPEACWDVCRL